MTAKQGVPAFQRHGKDSFQNWEANNPGSDLQLRDELMFAHLIAIHAAQYGNGQALCFQSLDAAFEATRARVSCICAIVTAADACIGEAKSPVTANQMKADTEAKLFNLCDFVVAPRDLVGAGD
jgi:hypothetical protein